MLLVEPFDDFFCPTSSNLSSSERFESEEILDIIYESVSSFSSSRSYKIYSN
jgi:hypothetical protein